MKLALQTFPKKRNQLAKMLAEKLKTPPKIYYWVQKNIKYRRDFIFDTWQTPDETIRKRSGDCEDIAFLIKAMLDHLGYKNVMIITKTEKGTGHIFNAVKYRGRWYIMDATCKTCKFGQFPKGLKQWKVAVIFDDKVIIYDPYFFTKCCIRW